MHDVDGSLKREISKLLAWEHPDPHRVLGPHREGAGWTIRLLSPGATAASVLASGERFEMKVLDPVGVFAASLPGSERPTYNFEVSRPDGAVQSFGDPYSHEPTLGELDEHLLGEGKHERLWEKLGARVVTHGDVAGTAFAVWAPNARSVMLAADFNDWDPRRHPMRRVGSTGVWELFVPGVGPRCRYKFGVVNVYGSLVLKTDPLATAAETPPRTASIVYRSKYEWKDSDWIDKRSKFDPLREPMSIYECHLGSWRRHPDGTPFSYRELAEELPGYLKDLGYTHLELLPVAEHPFGGSWGYQLSHYYAPSARYGEPDDLRYLIDRLHQEGIGVIVDWVPAHFPKDQFALSRFDGTALYEHADPRRGEQPDWGTLIFNLSRPQVTNFLIANALYWIEEFHIDGLRVDAVASMLYLDYSREQGQWVPNKYGGRENLEAVEFLKNLNIAVHGKHPGVCVIAEESTAWPGVSRPVYAGGLGFTFKWNMGWMHDTLDYFAQDPVYRKFHHGKLTFGLLYAWSENFVLPLSHDEVVYGKRSLLHKMPGDRWRRFANLRILVSWMAAHPGKQLMFMGGEIAQEREWNHDGELDWDLLKDPAHRGVQDLIRELNKIYRSEQAFWELDHEPRGFKWIDANDNENQVLSFLRLASDGSVVACIANLAPTPRDDYQVGLPLEGRWELLLNTDSPKYGGSGVGMVESHDATADPYHGLPASTRLRLPPLGVLWLKGPNPDHATDAGPITE